MSSVSALRIPIPVGVAIVAKRSLNSSPCCRSRYPKCSFNSCTHWPRRLPFIAVPVDVDVTVIVELLFPVGTVLSFGVTVPISEAVFL
jgi:hypothetical protein